MPGRILIRFERYVDPYIPGQVVSMPEGIGRNLIKRGFAIEHVEPAYGERSFNRPPADKMVRGALDK